MTLIKIHLARLLFFPSLLCLDAPFIALGWAFCLSFDLGGDGREAFSPVAAAPAAALFLSVWLIYLFDRLYDVARSGASVPLTRRHEWARGHRSWLGGLFVAALLFFLLVVLPRLEPKTIATGLAPGLITGLYYLAFRFSPLSVRLRGAVPLKEITIALCFAGGIVLVAAPTSFSPGFIPLVAGYLSLFAANCLLISRAERGLDLAGDPAAYFSPSTRRSRLPEWGALLAPACGLVTPVLEAGWVRSSTSLILCGLLTWWLTRRSGDEDRRTQALADGILLLPWFVLSGEVVWRMFFASECCGNRASFK